MTAPIKEFDVMEAIGVEDYLKKISYAIDVDYVPTDFALSFVTFIKLVNGAEGEENKTPLMHYKMLDTIVSGYRKMANLCFRGSAKTTLFGEYMFLYLGVYGELPGFGAINLALYISDSIENGVKNMRKNLEHRWENSDFLREYIPVTRFTDIRWEFHNADCQCKLCSPDKPGKPKILIVKGYGAKTGVRGAKEMGVRPQMAVMDDLVSDEDARSKTVIETIENTVHKAVNHALHPKRRIQIWSGTPFNQGDPLYKAVESGAWAVNVFPICEVFPCPPEDFRGAWEDRFSYEYILSQYNDAKMEGKISGFDQELMLRIMSDEDRLIEDQDIRWYKRDNVLKHRGRFNFYITTDFATSEKQSADFSVISVWALNHNGDWFWVDGIRKRQDMGANMNDLFRLSQFWRPQSVGIEVTGQQGGFIPWIQNEMMERNIYFTLASGNNDKKPGIRPATNKLQRFNVVEPWFKQGKMYFPVEKKSDVALKGMIEELELASPSGFRSKTDDSIDTVSQLGEMETYPPSEMGSMVEGAEGMWELDEPDYTENALDNYIV